MSSGGGAGPPMVAEGPSGAEDLRTTVDGGSLAIKDARILPSPDAPPIERGTVLVRHGRITTVGPDVPVPPEVRVISGAGRVVTAGFWNAHVHFTEAKWRRAARTPAVLVEAYLHDMLTSRGFTSVVDLGSDPRSTMSLRRRIERDGLLGPAIYTAGPGVYPPRGIPYYLRESLPIWYRPFMPQPSSPRAARRIAERNLARGADVVKLFTGSYVERGRVATMPEPIARAAVEAAHAHGRLVFSHPSNLEGTRVAVRSGVDILAHPPDSSRGMDMAVVQEMVDRRMSMTPTLKMFADTVSTSPEYLDPIDNVVREFHRRGGQLLFGTDIGYMTDYATEDEFQALGRCGVDARAILRMLTTAPAERFGVGAEFGSVTAGKRGDLVLLDEDPFAHPRAFSRVRATIRDGRVLHLLQ